MTRLAEFEKQKTRFADWLTKHKQTDLSPIVNGDIHVYKLLPLCFDEQKNNRSLHAIWLLEKYIKAFPEMADIILPELLANLANIHIEGSQRIAGNILIEALSNRNEYTFTPEQEELIIEITFNWLITPGKAIAVVANCFEILCVFSPKYDWIKEELRAQIDYFMKDGSAAIQARGKKMLKKMG